MAQFQNTMTSLNPLVVNCRITLDELLMHKSYVYSVQGQHFCKYCHKSIQNHLRASEFGPSRTDPAIEKLSDCMERLTRLVESMDRRLRALEEQNPPPPYPESASAPPKSI